MERRSLECFTLVAKLGSMSAAAERLSVTQPAVSKQIRRLEEQLGVLLFHRTPSGLSTTAAGRTLLELGNDVLMHFDRAESIMQARFRGRSTFRLACPHSTALDMVAPFIAETDPPIVDVDILLARDLDSALNGEVDMAIGSLMPPRHRAQLPVATIAVTVQTPVGSRSIAPSAERVDLENLVDDWLIVPRTGVQVAVVEAMSSLNHTPPIREASAGTVAQALAANGHGYALVTEPPRFGLRTIPAYVGGRPIEIVLYASWDAHHYASRELRQLAVDLRRWLEMKWQWSPRSRSLPLELQPLVFPAAQE